MREARVCRIEAVYQAAGQVKEGQSVTRKTDFKQPESKAERLQGGER